MSPEQLLGELEGDGGYVIGDLEAGTATVLRLRPGDVDVVMVVAQPTAKSIDVAARATRTARHRHMQVIVVANRVRDEDDLEAVRSAVGDVEIVAVPEDPAIVGADRDGRAPLDAAGASPAVRAMTALADRLAGARAQP